MNIGETPDAWPAADPVGRVEGAVAAIVVPRLQGSGGPGVADRRPAGSAEHAAQEVLAASADGGRPIGIAGDGILRCQLAARVGIKRGPHHTRDLAGAERAQHLDLRGLERPGHVADLLDHLLGESARRVLACGPTSSWTASRISWSWVTCVLWPISSR